MRYNRHEIIKIIKSKELPLDLLYDIYTEECQNRNFQRASPKMFQLGMENWLAFNDLSEFLLKRFEINQIYDQNNNLIHLY